MLKFLRRSLLRQLLGVYLMFVSAVLGTGLAVNFIVQDRLRSEVQSSDLALAQAIALETDDTLHDARDAVRDMAAVPVVQNADPGAMLTAFRAFKAARKDVDRIYWLDPEGTMRVSVPSDVRTENMSMAQSSIFQRARSAATGSDPLLQAGVVDLTTFNAVVSIAFPVRDSSGHFKGVLATNLLLDDLSLPLRTVARDQQQRGHAIEISMIDDQGQLIGTLERERLLQPVLQDMPGAADALAGRSATRLSPGPQSQNWLYTSAPIHNAGWAVVVQRPASDAMSVVDNFTAWLSAATVLFGLGGLLFWLVLARQVINPLYLLARSHRSVGISNSRPTGAEPLAARPDEIGEVARSLVRLERDVNTRLGELHTLLDTSTAVVSTLDPRAVAEAIIFEVGRLVDVQAASIRVPGDDGLLRVLASVGRGPRYEESEAVHPADPHSPAARALRDGHPVQMVADDGSEFPLISYREGFRALLAIPIVSPRAGQVVLLVNRVSPTPFTAQEIELLLTFANYAALAWEHAVLYERSDERLQEIARENERLYRRTEREKQTLEAIMSSMSDGLVLTGTDGAILYANPGATVLAGQDQGNDKLKHIEDVHVALRSSALDPIAYDISLEHAEAGSLSSWLFETRGQAKIAPYDLGVKGVYAKPAEQGTRAGASGQTIQVRLFDVRDEAREIIGRGMILRDVTREQEIDRLKTSLLAAVGHEIRTPLAAIKGNASTLLQTDVSWSAADQRHFLQTISDEADRLARLVSNLLDLSRHELGLLPLSPIPTQVEDLIAGAVSHLHPAITELTTDIEPDLPPVGADLGRIEVVLHNLLANARAYGNGSVHLSARQAGWSSALPGKR